jgi:hypothetical protein
MACTDSDTAAGRRRQRAIIRAKLADLNRAEQILAERGDTNGADIMRRVRIAWHALCIAPRVVLPGEDPNDLSEMLRWSPVTAATHALARAVIESVDGPPVRRTPPREVIRLAVPG